jgi:hypothetical protein
MQQAFGDPTYQLALRNKRMFKVRNSACTIRLLTSKGIITLLRTSAADWNWKNT